MSDKIVSLEKNLPHYVDELICLKCLHRAIHVYPTELLLKNIECSNCGEIGYMIKTGQILEDNTDRDNCKNCIHLHKETRECKLLIHDKENCGFHTEMKEY